MKTRIPAAEDMLAREQWVKNHVAESVKAAIELHARMSVASYNNALKASVEAERKWIEDRSEEWADAIVQHLYAYIQQQRLHRRIGRAIAAWYRSADVAIGRTLLRFKPEPRGAA